VTFKISGSGRLIGVGNGNPSSHESDKGDQRRAFNGLCMAIVQASKQPGDLVVEASSPGLEPALVKIRCNAAALRAAVPLWQPTPVETGPGIVGLWKTDRPSVMGSVTIIFQRTGDTLTGMVENDPVGALEIEDGKIDGDQVSFTGGFLGYSGKLDGDELTLRIRIPGGESDKSKVMPTLTLKKSK
jgi:beta-galactosidase